MFRRSKVARFGFLKDKVISRVQSWNGKLFPKGQRSVCEVGGTIIANLHNKCIYGTSQNYKGFGKNYIQVFGGTLKPVIARVYTR